MEKLFINDELVRKIKKSFMEYYNKNSRAVSLKDIRLILEAWKSGDYSSVFKTDLYNKRGGDYCRLLEIIYSIVGNKELV